MKKKNSCDDDDKSLLRKNLDYVLRSSNKTTKFIFDYCVRNNFFEIAALLVDKLHFAHCFKNLDAKTIVRIFDERNLNGNQNLISEKSLFFLTYFSHLKVEHLKGYNADQLFNIFESYYFISRNYSIEAQRVMVEAIFSLSLNSTHLKRYLKSAYSGYLQTIINQMIENFQEKNSKEKDSFIRKSNLLNVVQAAIPLPISIYEKIALLNDLKFSSEEEKIKFIELLNNPLPFEEALNRLIDSLYLEYKLDDSINKTLKLLE